MSTTVNNDDVSISSNSEASSEELSNVISNMIKLNAEAENVGAAKRA